MNSISLLLLPLVSAGLLVASPTPPVEESKEQIQAYLAQLDTDAPEPAAPVTKPATGALATSGLATSRLQPSSGIQSGARGLSEASAWQRTFPRYSKR